MLGVEPERDSQGRIGQLRLVPAAALGRPRINVVVQVSGQLRDIADSRLKLITEAIRMASAAEGDSNFVSEGTLAQEKELIERGVSPQQARELATLRVFGPVNNGYSTGMMNFIERSEKWTSTDELTDQYLNNMCVVVAYVGPFRCYRYGTPQVRLEWRLDQEFAQRDERPGLYATSLQTASHPGQSRPCLSFLRRASPESQLLVQQDGQ